MGRLCSPVSRTPSRPGSTRSSTSPHAPTVSSPGAAASVSSNRTRGPIAAQTIPRVGVEPAGGRLGLRRGASAARTVGSITWASYGALRICGWGRARLSAGMRSEGARGVRSTTGARVGRIVAVGAVALLLDGVHQAGPGSRRLRGRHGERHRRLRPQQAAPAAHGPVGRRALQGRRVEPPVGRPRHHHGTLRRRSVRRPETDLRPRRAQPVQRQGGQSRRRPRRRRVPRRGLHRGSSPGARPARPPAASAISPSSAAPPIFITLAFPGKVISSTTGEIDGNSVTWTPKLGETTDSPRWRAPSGATASPGSGC